MKQLKLLFVIIIMVSFSNLLSAQYDLSDANTNFEDENYEVALKQYLKAFKKIKNDAQVCYRIGFCYLKTNYDKKEALSYLLKADSLKPNGYPTILFDIAHAYFHSLNFEKAEEYTKTYSKQKLKPEELSAVDKFFETCENAKKLIANPVNITFINMGKTINSPQDDYIPFITEDENFLVFTSARKYNSDFQQFIKGVYFCKKSNGTWSPASAASSKINSDENEEAVGISKDASTLLVHVDRLSNPHDIFYSEKNKSGNFGELIDFGSTINSKSSEMGASLSATGDTLYFASDRPGGFGGFDIYMSFKLPNGTWSKAINLGEPINTADDENYPYITADGTTLYISCNGRNSMGGYDIYKSKLVDGKWSEPVNLGYPINDTYDNFNIALTSNSRYGYLSKSDSTSLGGLDIYRVIFNNVPPTNIVYTGDIMVGNESKAVPYDKVDPHIDISVYNNDNSNQVFSYQPSKKGKYTIALTPGNWNLEVKGDAYETYKKNIVIRDEQPTQTMFIEDIYLCKKIKK